MSFVTSCNDARFHKSEAVMSLHSAIKNENEAEKHWFQIILGISTAQIALLASTHPEVKSVPPGLYLLLLCWYITIQNLLCSLAVLSRPIFLARLERDVQLRQLDDHEALKKIYGNKTPNYRAQMLTIDFASKVGKYSFLASFLLFLSYGYLRIIKN